MPDQLSKLYGAQDFIKHRQRTSPGLQPAKMTSSLDTESFLKIKNDYAQHRTRARAARDKLHGTTTSTNSSSFKSPEVVPQYGGKVKSKTLSNPGSAVLNKRGASTNSSGSGSG